MPRSRGAPRLLRTRPRTGLAVLAAMACIGLLLPTGALAQPVPAASAGVAADSWAYGASRTISATGTAADGNTSYTLHASYGWNTLITQTNGTGGAFEITVNRTVGASLYVTYCRPDCSHALRTLNITEHAWETILGHANFTSSGTVWSSGNSTPAIALVNSSVEERGNLSEVAQASVDTLRGSATAHESLYVSVAASVSVGFVPPLGLFPINTSLPSWNSSAQYSASGSWLLELATSTTTFMGATTSNEMSYPGNFTGATGVVAVQGSLAGPMVLRNGASVEQMDESISGPFAAWEGFILVPSAADLFAPNGAAWRPAAAGAQLATTERVDLGHPGSVGHLPVLASATDYTASATDAGSPSLETGVSAALIPSTSAPVGGDPDGPGPAAIQAQPESPSVASTSSSCLIASCSSAPSARLPHLLLLAGLAGVVVALAAVAVVVKRQPPRRAPPSPNAKLYPPVSGAGAPRRSAPAGHPPSRDDPLANLW